MTAEENEKGLEMKTQFSKQDLIDLCNEFLRYFVMITSGQLNQSIIFKINLKNILNTDDVLFENLVIDIKNYLYDSKHERITEFQNNDKILHIETLSLSRETILKIGSNLLYAAQMTVAENGMLPRSMISELSIKFHKLLCNDLNLAPKCAFEFIQSLRTSVSDEN